MCVPDIHQRVVSWRIVAPSSFRNHCSGRDNSEHHSCFGGVYTQAYPNLEQLWTFGDTVWWCLMSFHCWQNSRLLKLPFGLVKRIYIYVDETCWNPNCWFVGEIPLSVYVLFVCVAQITIYFGSMDFYSFLGNFKFHMLKRQNMINK